MEGSWGEQLKKPDYFIAETDDDIRFQASWKGDISKMEDISQASVDSKYRKWLNHPVYNRSL